MFNLQGSEIIIILLLALVVLGPEKLPEAMRKAGQFYGELKKMSTGFQAEFKAAVDEPLRELKDTANTIRDSADFTKLQSGERTEKPKSAEMSAAADPGATPTTELPLAEDAASAQTEPETAGDQSEGVDSGEGEAADSDRLATTPIPALPAPFSSSQQLGTSPRPSARRSPDDGGDSEVAEADAAEPTSSSEVRSDETQEEQTE